MTKELAREVSGFYSSSPCEVWWIAESVLNMSRSRADGTTSSWLLYFRNFTNFHTVSYIIWTPLWTKCASAAAILSNISADALCSGCSKILLLHFQCFPAVPMFRTYKYLFCFPFRGQNDRTKTSLACTHRNQGWNTRSHNNLCFLWIKQIF